MLRKTFFHLVVPVISLSLVLLLAACSTLKSKSVPTNGISGAVIPVDRDGQEITQQDKQKIIINCIPLKQGAALPEKSVTYNPDSEGRFMFGLKTGDYNVEIFLKGFHVKNYQITVLKDEIVELGTVQIREIEAGEGKPVKGDKADEVILNEGDVNIQPPS
jgi:hypothetical protein